jgi:hypothetical protein
VEERKKIMPWDKEHGFMPSSPYAGGNKYKVETITVKPGFKVWVDGGIITYD